MLHCGYLKWQCILIKLIGEKWELMWCTSFNANPFSCFHPNQWFCEYIYRQKGTSTVKWCHKLKVNLQEHQSSNTQDQCLLKHMPLVCCLLAGHLEIKYLLPISETVAYWTQMLGNGSFPPLHSRLFTGCPVQYILHRQRILFWPHSPTPQNAKLSHSFVFKVLPWQQLFSLAALYGNWTVVK